jgi:hypothetical protein
MLKSGLDLLIVLLYANNQARIEGITRLVKLLFLLIKEGGFHQFENEYEFEAYDYGPWSARTFSFLESAQEVGLVTVRQKPFVNYQEVADDLAEAEVSEIPELADKVKVFSLTDRGIRVGQVLYGRLSDTEKQKLESIKRSFNTMRLDELLRYVYSKYYSYTRKSKIRAKMLPRTMFGVSPDLPEYEREEDDFRGQETGECLT